MRRADLQVELAMVVPDDSGCETCGAGALARGVDSDGGNLGCKFEKLGFGSGRVANEQHVDITPPVCAIWHSLHNIIATLLWPILSTAWPRSHDAHDVCAACWAFTFASSIAITNC